MASLVTILSAARSFCLCVPAASLAILWMVWFCRLKVKHRFDVEHLQTNVFLVDSRVLRPQWCTVYTTLYDSCCKRNRCCQVLSGAVRCCGVYVFHLPAPKQLSWALKTQPQQPSLHTTLAVVPALDSCGLFNVNRVPFQDSLDIRYPKNLMQHPGPTKITWGIAVDGMGRKLPFMAVHIIMYAYVQTHLPNYAKYI